jgi:hypothetical protein
MKHVGLAALILTSLCSGSFGQSTFEVTGTPLPATLLKQNDGKTPKGITAYDLNICNSSGLRQSVVSSEIYQALSRSDAALQPTGRHVVLASILRTQNWSALRLVNIALNAVTGALMVLAPPKGSGQLLAAIALGTLATQQLTSGLPGSTAADQLEKFEAQVLQPALVLDAGSCAERTVFTALDPEVTKPAGLSFHVR